MTLPGLEEIESAAAIVHGVIPPTPLIRWPLLCDRTGADIWVKHENHTPVGAFKLRGGLVYMERLRRVAPAVNGVIAATRGNHGQSVAFAAAKHGMRAVIVVPRGNSPEKNAAIQALKAELIERGRDFQEAYEHAVRIAAAESLHLVPSFDATLVSGVATYGLELFRGGQEFDAVYVPIGLGSGICGVIAVRNALGLKTQVIGVCAAGAPAYARSFAAGRPIATETAETIADGMACRTPIADAVSIINQNVARVVTVNDGEIQLAMQAFFSDTHNVAEGAGAAALAALLCERNEMHGRRVALILTGGNVDRGVFAQVLAASDPREFIGALNEAFDLKEVEGHTEYTWTPRSYTVQADIGAVTGAQASIYTRAKAALDQSMPLLDGLYPLIPCVEPDDLATVQSVRTQLTALVNEFGVIGGPRVPRVDESFDILLGPGSPSNPEDIIESRSLGLVRLRFGLERKYVTTVDDEQNLTNYLILVDYWIALKKSWDSEKSFLVGPTDLPPG